MRKRSVGVRAWARMLGLEKTVVEAVAEENGAIVISSDRTKENGNRNKKGTARADRTVDLRYERRRP